MRKARNLGVLAAVAAVLVTTAPAVAVPTRSVVTQGIDERDSVRCAAPSATSAHRAAASRAPAPRKLQASAADSAYSAPLTPQRMIPGEEYAVEVAVTNPTARSLPQTDFVLSYHWSLPDGTDYTRPSNTADTRLPGDLAPGQTVTVTATVKAPIRTELGNQRESFVLDWDLRHQRTDRWLSDTDGVPTLTQPVTAENPTSDQLGLEKYYQYTGIAAGGGWSATVNQFSGNAVVGYNALSNPGRGLSTFVRLTYNSMDNSDSFVGRGWSLTTSSLHRLGSPLQFHVPLLGDPDYPTKVTLVDGDGTSHLFELNKHDSHDKRDWTYDSPAGVHLYLQRTGSRDRTRAWVMTAPDRTKTFYDTDGYQTALADKNSNEMTFTYARTTHGNRNTGALTEVTDATGRRVLTLDYYQRGDDFLSFVDNVRVFGRDLTNTSIIDQVKSVTDVSGRRITFAYSDRGHLQEVVDGAGTSGQKVFGFFYADPGHADSKLVRINDGLGHGTQVRYFEDLSDQLRKRRVQSLVDRGNHTTGFDYADADGADGSSIATAVTDANGNRTRLVLDGYGRPTRKTNAKGEVTDLAWDDDNNVRLYREHNGATTTWRYDGRTGYPLEIRDAEANAHDTPATTLGYRTGLDGYTADLVEKTSPEGRKWTFGSDDRGNLTSVTDPKGFTTKYAYDEFGQLITATDANGNTTRFSDYDPVGFPGRTVDALDCATTTVYDVVGNVVSTTDAKQKTSTFTYDIFKRPTGSKVPKDAAANQYIVTPGPRYDQNDNVVVSYAPNGATATSTYGPMDEVTSVTLPKDSATSPAKTSTFRYDAMGNVVRSTEPEGTLTRGDDNDFTTTYTYDQLNRLVAITNADGGKGIVGYDSVGNAVTATSALNKTSRTEYDLNHRPTRMVDPVGHDTRTEYDRDGNVVATIDQDGTRTAISVDERGAVTEVRVPHDDGVDRVTRYAYDAVGNRTKTVTPKGVETTDDPDDFVEEIVYDELNRVKEKLTPFDKDDPRVKTPQRTIFGYDEVGNLVETSEPPSAGQTVRNVTRNTYFDNGWLRTSTDPWNIRAEYDYDLLGNQTKRTLTAASGSATRTMEWDYYQDGKLKTRKDDGVPVGKDVLVVDNSDPVTEAVGEWGTGGSGQQHEGYDYRTHDAGTGQDTFTWNVDVPRAGTYEVLVRYTSAATATDATYRVEHDGGGESRTVDQTQQPGEWVSLGSYGFTEDALKKITLSDDADGTVVADAVKLVRDGSGEVDNEQKRFDFVYDTNDNLREMTDSTPGAKVSRYVIEYTQLNQVRRVDEIGSVTTTSSYTYDLDGNVHTRDHPAQSSTYEYDARNMLAKVTNTDKAPGATPQVSTFEYTKRGQPAKETKPNGNTVVHDYFLDGQPEHYVERKPDNTIVNEHTLSYDANGHRVKDIAKTMNADDHSAYLERVHTYSFDPMSRLRSSVKSDSAGAELERESYVHDANGNVVEQVVDGTTTTFTYDRNKLMTTTADGVTATSSYDPFGRLQKVTAEGRVLEKYRYDGFDRIAEHQKAKEGSAERVAIQYAYDPLDRTTTRTEGGETTDYAYFGLSEEVLTEQLAGTLQKSYQYSPNGKRLSQVSYSDEGAPETAQYGYNPHTDVEVLTDENGDSKATYGYTAYGKDDEESFTGIDKPDPQQPDKEPYNFYRFNGKRWDSSTDGYDMGFRDYNPGMNRFVTRDNYNGALSDMNLGLNPWTGNRYAFAGGNPVTGVELDGHAICADDGCHYVCAGECSNEQAQALTDRMAADSAAAAMQQEWTEAHSPTTNDPDRLRTWFYAFPMNSLLSVDGAPGNFWAPQVGEDGAPSTVCFGRTACNRAYVHLLENPDDVAGAKYIAANYCVEHFDECNADAAAYDTSEHIKDVAMLGLGPGGSLRGVRAGQGNSAMPAQRYGPGAQRRGEPKWPVPTASNCSECAIKIQQIIGGDIKTFRSSGAVLGPSKHNPAGDWSYHSVVVLNGRVYDGFTGPRGLTIAEFKAQFLYADGIRFGF